MEADSNMTKRSNISNEYTVPFGINAKYMLSGATFIQYGDLWYLWGLYASMSGVTGYAEHITESEYVERFVK